MPLKPPRPSTYAAIEVNAARGPHTPIPPPQRAVRPPLSNPPPPPQRGKLDSREVTTDTLLAEYKGEAEARRAAEAREADLKLQLAAAESGSKAVGPKVSLGSAQWWVLVIGALAAAFAAAGPPLREWARPSASAEQISAVQSDLKSISARITAREETVLASAAAEAKRWTISAAFACSQGFRARGLDCSAAQSYADIQPVPLQPKGAPQWKANAAWPTVPIPNE